MITVDCDAVITVDRDAVITVDCDAVIIKLTELFINNAFQYFSNLS